MRYEFPMIICAALDRLSLKFFCVFDLIRMMLICWLNGIRRERGVVFSGAPLIRTRVRGSISIGEGSCLQSHIKRNLVGVANPCIIDTRAGGGVRIGRNSGMTSCVISSRTEVRIGNNVKIGGNVRIFDHDFHSLNATDRRQFVTDFPSVRSAPVCIGDDVFIGTNAIILKGSEIGDRSIVAAGSVVFGLKVPPDSLVKGNPAAIIKRFR